MLIHIIFIGLTALAIAYFLIPVLFWREKSPSPSSSDSDDSRIVGECFDDREEAERLIENEVKHNPATNADFIKKLIWIFIVAVAVFSVFYMSIL